MLQAAKRAVNTTIAVAHEKDIRFEIKHVMPFGASKVRIRLSTLL